MIVPMKVVTLLCLAKDKVQTLEALRALGVIQLIPGEKAHSQDISDAKKKLVDAERVSSLLATRKAPKDAKPDPRSAEEIAACVLELLETQTRVAKNLDQLNRDYEKLLPWGDFSFSDIEKLKAGGVYVALCMVPRDAEPVAPEGASVTVIQKTAAGLAYVVVSQTPIAPDSVPEVTLPHTSLSKVEFEINKNASEAREIESELNLLAASQPAVRAYAGSLAQQLEFVTARDTMGEADQIQYLSGYVPVTKVEDLRDAALKNGWALQLDDPAPGDENVPTLIVKPKWMSIIDPLFDFIGVTPGYRENDVNLFFILFFPIFFGMLIGDAAYGFLFITIALILKFTACRGKESARLPINLFIFLSCYSVLWGWLNGSWFGIPRNFLPDFMQGMNFFADPGQSPLCSEIAEKLNIHPVGLMKDKIVQWICFLLAAVHLSAARIFKLIVDIRNWRSFGHLGWAMLIWANFFMAVNLVVFPGTFPTFGYVLYGLGVLLICVTITGAAALNLPFALIGSFVDVLSYVRLFAVGLSGAYIALNFNKMGGMAMDALPSSLYILGLIALVAIALFGHLLNIALGFLGVLVHAIRLNTLEFSNHIDMQWAGRKFTPFADKKTESK